MFHTFLRVLGAASETTIRNWIVGQLDCFSHDITTAMLVCQTLPVRAELFSYVETFFFSVCIAAGHVGKTLYTKTLRTVKTSPYYF